MNCANRKCGDRLRPYVRFPLCPSCRYAYGWGGFIGGLIVGIGLAILKAAKVL